MADTTNTRRVTPEAVGQEQSTEPRREDRVGGWLGKWALTFIVALIVALIFIGAIIVTGVMN